MVYSPPDVHPTTFGHTPLELPLKRIVVGLLAAFLTFTGLAVTVGSPSATAACPYTNCVRTSTTVDGTRIDRNTVTYDVTVKSAGNTWPRGRVSMVITKFATNKVIYSRVRRVAQESTNSSVINFSTGNLKRGTYTLRFIYRADSDTVFQNSAKTRKLRIR